MELLSTKICLAWNFFLDKNRITNQISIGCILLVTGIQLLFAYPKNHVEIRLVGLFLSRKKYHAKQDSSFQNFEVFRIPKIYSAVVKQKQGSSQKGNIKLYWYLTKNCLKSRFLFGFLLELISALRNDIFSRLWRKKSTLRLQNIIKQVRQFFKEHMHTCVPANQLLCDTSSSNASNSIRSSLLYIVKNGVTANQIYTVCVPAWNDFYTTRWILINDFANRDERRRGKKKQKTSLTLTLIISCSNFTFAPTALLYSSLDLLIAQQF